MVVLISRASDCKPLGTGSVVDQDPGPGTFFDPWIRDGEKIRIRDKHPGPYFRELRNNVLAEKYLNSLMQIRIRDL
jgi:hypothetical protein